MGISLSKLTEGCCLSLKDLKPLDLDAYKSDKSMSSVDNVLECDDKYIFIEEKSFLLDYYRLAGIEIDSYLKPVNGEISDDFLQRISKLDKEVKKKLMYQSLYEKTISSVDKVKDTTFILCGDDDFCNKKVKNAITIYLYCQSGEPIDNLLTKVFDLKKAKSKDKFVACKDLIKILEKKGC
ncbi:MAG: Unknown protein [uncultured Sulfurovum sp.]|uniref:Uncharacterized protein n=1 Tax=uncultured Sulfurovum sp. TaxID=269237 RepID=A0A6S6TJV8_9BACT|nr:MAG: Unknown protein [uncultured Sulfurovum sp.]